MFSIMFTTSLAQTIDFTGFYVRFQSLGFNDLGRTTIIGQVPVPAGFGLLAMALAGFGVAARRKRRLEAA